MNKLTFNKVHNYYLISYNDKYLGSIELIDGNYYYNTIGINGYLSGWILIEIANKIKELEDKLYE